MLGWACAFLVVQIRYVQIAGENASSCSTGKSVSHKTVAAYSGIIVLPPFRKKKLFPLYST